MTCFSFLYFHDHREQKYCQPLHISISRMQSSWFPNLVTLHASTFVMKFFNYMVTYSIGLLTLLTAWNSLVKWNSFVNFLLLIKLKNVSWSLVVYNIPVLIWLILFTFFFKTHPSTVPLINYILMLLTFQQLELWW